MVWITIFTRRVSVRKLDSDASSVVLTVTAETGDTSNRCF
jgi:hypothetical protein